MRDGIYQVEKNRNRNIVKTPLRIVSNMHFILKDSYVMINE